MIRFAPTARVRRSPYYHATVAAGATDFTVYNHMLLPMGYGDPEAEYRRLVDAVTMWDVAAQRQIEISGAEAGRLVQYLTARDLSAMVPGQARYVALCDYDGVLLNDPVLLRLADDRYWFSIADGDIALWARAIGAERGMAARVAEVDVSPLALQGPRAVDVAIELFGPAIADLGRFHFVETELAGIPLVVCRSGWSGQDGFELFLTDGARGTDLWERVAEAGTGHGIGPGAPNAVERIESGLLAWGGDNAPGSNPFECGLAPFVDVETTVDYIGKVALQKVAAEGPARIFVGLFVDVDHDDWSPLAQRSVVTRFDEVVGTIGALAWSPRLDRTIGLAQIDRQIVEQGAPVEVIVDERTRKATITSLPFL